MVKIDDLKDLTNEELQTIVTEATAIIEERKTAQRQQAIDAAKETLAAAGLTIDDLRKRPAVKRRKGPAPQQGQRYVNPDNPKQVWVAGKGRRPKWVSQVIAGGQ